MKNYTVEALILKRMDFGETDRIITLLTPNHGKIRAVAKGVRRPGSRLAGHLEPFSHAKVFLAKGRNLDIITQAQTLNQYRELRADLSAVSMAFYLSELAERVSVEGEKNYPLFNLFTQTLSQLATEGERNMLLSWFDLSLLELLGYKPDLQRCHECGHDIPTQASYTLTASGLVCRACQDHTAGGICIKAPILANLRLLQDGFFDVAGSSLDWKEVTQTRQALQFIMAYTLQRQFRASDFMEKVQRLCPEA
ncbi:MAG TPA: DNA repair protein RecO [bacterium]|nr:DNA repair protein RecO [bacterium]